MDAMAAFRALPRWNRKFAAMPNDGRLHVFARLEARGAVHIDRRESAPRSATFWQTGLLYNQDCTLEQPATFSGRSFPTALDFLEQILEFSILPETDFATYLEMTPCGPEAMREWIACRQAGAGLVRLLGRQQYLELCHSSDLREQLQGTLYRL